MTIITAALWRKSSTCVLFIAKTRKAYASSSLKQCPCSCLRTKTSSVEVTEDVDRVEWTLKLIHLFEAVSHVTIKFLMFYDLTIHKLQTIKNRRMETAGNSTNISRLSLSQSKQRPRAIRIEQETSAKESEKELEKAFGGPEAEYEIKKQALQTIINKGLLGKNLLNEFYMHALDIIHPHLEAEQKWDCFHPFPFVPGAEAVKDEAQETGSEDEQGVDMQNNLDYRLFGTAVDCLCKFMILVPHVCEDNLDLFFKLLEAKSTPQAIKNNLLVTMGDLIRRHSTIMTEKMKLIFRNLRLKDANLRRTSVIVLCQLVLNDYLKLQEEIIDFVVLLNDPDENIRNTLGTFFSELKKKDFKIFSNMIPDAINRFSTHQVQKQSKEDPSETCRIQEEDNSNSIEKSDLKTKEKFEKIYEEERLHEIFTKFLKFIIEFIDRDKMGPVLVEKLCNKLKFNKNKLEVLNIFKCFYFFVSNDNGVLKLLENGTLIKEKMEHLEVQDMMQALLSMKLKKSNKVAKTTLDDFEKLIQSRNPENEDDAVNGAIDSKTRKTRTRVKPKV